jgi:hypothetical protein
LIVEGFDGQHRRVKTDFGRIAQAGWNLDSLKAGKPHAGGQGSESLISQRHAARGGLIATGGLA